MAKRTITALLGAAIALLVAAPAHATLVYVKGPVDSSRVAVADDDGTNRHRIGTGHAPAVSDDGLWVAWVTNETPARVMLRRSDRTRKARELATWTSVGELRFSADSRKLGYVAGSRPGFRLWVYNIRHRELLQAASGQVRGFSFSPDSKAVAFGTAGRSDAPDAPSDLYWFSLAKERRHRITRDRQSLNPLWTPGWIIHDRQKVRPNAAPEYNLFKIHRDGGSLRRITRLKMPPALNGLVPLELADDGTRLLAQLIGTDTNVGFAVNVKTRKTRALSDDAESGFVAADLEANGRTVLGTTGGPAPGNRHDVVKMPWRGSKKPKVLVERARDPDWSR